MTNESDTNAVLQELLVDWDDLTSKDYNPIQNAIKLNDADSQAAVKFRNFYHKVDSEMNQIIQNKQQGFNDTIRMYHEILFLYRKFDKTLESIEKRFYKIHDTLNIDIEQLENEQVELYEQEGVFSILNKIEHIFKEYSKFDEKLAEEDFDYCTETVIEILEINKLTNLTEINDSTSVNMSDQPMTSDFLDEIGAFKEMKHLISKKRVKLLQKMYQNLLDKIFTIQKIEDELNLYEKQYNYRKTLSNIVKINGLLGFDEFIFENLKLIFYQESNKIIKKSENVHIFFTKIVNMALKINRTINEMRNLLNLKDEESFYGKKFTKFKIFCEKGEENCKAVLKNEISRLIVEYTTKEDTQKVDFDKDKLVDLIDYETLFENKYRISETFKRKSQKTNFYGDYKLIKKPSLRYIFVLKDAIDREINYHKEIITKNHDLTFSVSNLQIENVDSSISNSDI
ncbi:Exocyst complex subunit Sec8, partial [Pseudoloma neurophilia]